MERDAPAVVDSTEDKAQDHAKGEYKPVWIVHDREGKDGRPDIHFSVCIPNSVTPEQVAFHAEAEKTLTAIHAIFGSKDHEARYREVVQKLLMLAQLGLVGVRGQSNTTIASGALRSLQNEIAELDGSRIKNDFLKKLGFFAILTSVPSLFVISTMYIVFRDASFSSPLFNIGCLWCANQAGTWVSFASRKLDIGFFDLSRISEDQFEPAVRLIFTGFLAILFALTLWAGLFAVQIGSYEAAEWISSPLVAVVLGALTGIAEKALPANLRNKADKLVAV